MAMIIARRWWTASKSGERQELIYLPRSTFVLNNEGDTEERRIEIGLDDKSLVRIASGLQEGELVLLTPPLKAAATAPGSKLAGIRGADANDVMKRINEQLKAATEAVPITPGATRR